VWERVADGTLSLEFLKRLCKEYYFLGKWYTSEFDSIVSNAPDVDAVDLGSSEHFVHWAQNLADEMGFAGDRNHLDMKVEWAHQLGITDEELVSYRAMPESIGSVFTTLFYMRRSYEEGLAAFGWAGERFAASTNYAVKMYEGMRDHYGIDVENFKVHAYAEEDHGRQADYLLRQVAVTAGQQRRLISINHDPTALGRSVVPDLSILSDVRTGIRDLSDAVDGMLTKDRIARIRATRLAEVSAFTARLKQSRELALRAHFDSSPVTWERVGYELERVLDKDAVIVPELGTQYSKLYSQLKLGGSNKQKIGRTKGDALGWGVAAAFGVNLALPDRQVVALQGDGGFLFNQSEALWSIARYEAPMLIVIMNNHSYNESRARNMLNGGTFYEAGKDFNGYLGDPNVEYTKIAEAYGLKGEKVTRAGDLASALQRCLRSMRDGKAVVLDIDVAIDGAPLSQATWYQRYSIADVRKKRLNG